MGWALLDFVTTPPARLERWPRRTRCAHFGLKLSGAQTLVRPNSWLQPIQTVLNFVYHEPRVLAAIARGDDAPIQDQGMVLAREDDIDPDARRLWRDRTGTDLTGDIFVAAPSWIPGASYLPRSDLHALLSTMVSIHRQARFPWLFSARPCALEPAHGERELLTRLDADAAWSESLVLELEALGLDGHNASEKRAILCEWGLSRLVSWLDAAVVRLEIARERWSTLKWTAWTSFPPVSLRYFHEGVGSPKEVSHAAWLAACECAWQLIADRNPGQVDHGEWIVEVLGHRVALAWGIEFGTPMIIGWRPAQLDEPLAPLLTAVDRDRESRQARSALRLFARVHRIDDPTPKDRAYLAWLEAAWATIEAALSTADETQPDPRRSMLLGEATNAALFDVARRDELRRFLEAAEHHALVRLMDASASLLAYLCSAERRAVTGCRYFGRVDGAWVSPVWFLRKETQQHANPNAFTAECEAALHHVELGTAAGGRVRARIGGHDRDLFWRRELGQIPALSAIS